MKVQLITAAALCVLGVAAAPVDSVNAARLVERAPEAKQYVGLETLALSTTTDLAPVVPMMDPTMIVETST